MPFLNINTMILNVEELAILCIFPIIPLKTHHIRVLTAKTAPAPHQIPTSGLFLGKSVYRGQEKTFISV
jgi:hypothetical protein